MSTGSGTEGRRTQRDYSLDLIRCVAILLVLLCHVNKGGLPRDVSTILYSVTNVGVPLFVMLTGYLMLDRDYSGAYLRKYIFKNLLPMFLATELWNVIWYLAGLVVPMEDAASLGHMIKVAFWAGPTDSALWYMQMIFGLYLGIPILARVMRWLRDRSPYQTVLLVALIYFGTAVPTLSLILSAMDSPVSLVGALDVSIFGSNVWGGSVWLIYLIAGYLIKQINPKDIGGGRLCAALVCPLCINAAIYVFANRYHQVGLDMSYGSIFTVVASVALFLLIRRAAANRMSTGAALTTAVSSLSRYSFAIYMIHLWVYSLLTPLVYGAVGMNAPGLVLLVLSTGAISYFIARLIALSPLARRWLLLVK